MYKVCFQVSVWPLLGGLRSRELDVVTPESVAPPWLVMGARRGGVSCSSGTERIAGETPMGGEEVLKQIDK